MRTVLWNPKLFWLKFPATRAATHALFCPSGSATDASTMAGAARAIAVNLEMADIDMAMADVAPANAIAMADVAPAGAIAVADVAELMLERERLAMDREALRSFVVERHYVQAPEFSDDDFWSWRRAYGLQAELMRTISRHASEMDALAHRTFPDVSLGLSIADLTTEIADAVDLTFEIAGRR